MASDRSDDIDHLDFETPLELERRFAAAQPAPRAAPSPALDDDLDDGPTRLPGHHLRRAVVILVALLLLVALFLSSGVLGLFRPVQEPTEQERGIDASSVSSAAVARPLDIVTS